MELLIARNPDPDSKLPYLLKLPIGDGLVFRTKDTWPRTSALYCHPVPVTDWPAEPDVVERVPLRACHRRGAAIDVIADRGRENRSQIVFTHARGREMVFWQSPRTRKQARPDVRLPTARASGIGELEIVVDAHERYAYGFADQQVRTVTRGLACGDYAVCLDGKVVAAVERKSLPDLVGSLTSGRLRFALGELAALPRAAVVVEDRYSQVFAFTRVRPALVADGLAELQVRWPTVAIVFCETRKLAEEWTYRYLAAAFTWALDEQPALDRIGGGEHGTASAPTAAWTQHRRSPSMGHGQRAQRLRPRKATSRDLPGMAGSQPRLAPPTSPRRRLPAPAAASSTRRELVVRTRARGPLEGVASRSRAVTGVVASSPGGSPRPSSAKVAATNPG